MTEITQEGWKNKALSMLLAQLTSYVLFIAATVIPSPGTVPIIPLIIAALTLAAFVVFWPFRGSILDRIVTLVFGAISLIFVIVPFPTSEVPPDQTAADGSVLPWYSWALAMGLLLVVLVVFSFGRQMAREKREHLIRALSHAVTSGVAALAVAGWCFLPDLGAMLAKGTVAGTVALIILIVLGLALAVASTLWVRDADPDPDIRWGAAVAFGIIHDLPTLPLLIAALGDPVDRVRAEVLAAVAGFGVDAARLLEAQPRGGVPARDADICRLLAQLDNTRPG